MSHEFFVYTSYLITVLVFLIMFAWVFIDGRARKAELVRLEKSGVKRRSDQK